MPLTAETSPAPVKDTDVVLRVMGTVQGVGFRPFAARLAARYELHGWVFNDTRGVLVRIRGAAARVAAFRTALQTEAPPAARISEIATLTRAETTALPAARDGFTILDSPAAGLARDAAVTPDLALCADCRRELLDSANRRHHYPFINCTNCGPRYSIVRALPYDRPRTTMAGFTMCPACRREYDTPADRRYHAQPNACAACGPHLSFLDAHGREHSRNGAALEAALGHLRAGRIVAVKGIGGFHLFVDARDELAVHELRRRKHREEKPLAVMFPSLDALRLEALVDGPQAGLLQSPAAPIVLVRRRAGSLLAAGIAPGNPWIGALLPYAPLHVLLLAGFGGPLVATSANFTEEPLCIDNDEAVSRLAGIVDGFLVHDRPIARPVDDSVARFTSAGPLLLRRARGYAPAPLRLPGDGAVLPPTLCVGGHLKNTIAVTAGAKVVLSPHIGDLSNPVSIDAFRRTVELLTDLYGGGCERVVCDAHPGYVSTQFACDLGIPVTKVQHHLAHVLALMLEHGGGPQRLLGVSWDGTGYGDDGTVWGGEFIVVDRAARTARRVANLRSFLLPGGETAVREPRRSALGALHAAGLLLPEKHDELAARFAFRSGDIGLLLAAMERGVNAPVTTSAGRLFDAVAALLGLVRRNSFEGQGAMTVEFAADAVPASERESLPFQLRPAAGATDGRLEIDWAPALVALREAQAAGVSTGVLAMRFHRMLAASIAKVACEVGVEAVGLTGGCFQNALLSDLTSAALRDAGFAVFVHHELPPNDNAIAAGQALAAHWGIASTSEERVAGSG
jgi:hydrogenase maturation protein HypF